MNDSTNGRQLSPDARTLALIFGLALLLIGAGLMLYVVSGFSLNEVSRDPLATAGLHPLTGFQSQAGVLIWWAAASISLATWAVLRRSGSDPTLARFFLWSGLLTAMLALDDQFQFHDALASDWFGLRERFVIVGYAVIFGLYFLAFRKVFQRPEKLLLVLALAFAALSVMGDLVSQQFVEAGEPAGPGEVLNYLEDVMKLLAIVSWSAYLIRFSVASLRSLKEGGDEGLESA